MNAAAVGRLKRVFESLSSKPGYTLMRGFARFSTLRLSIPFLRAAVLKIKGRSHRDSLELEGKRHAFLMLISIQWCQRFERMELHLVSGCRMK